MKAKQIVLENTKIAFSSIRSNSVRSIITILIITFGIFALVGILTAITSIKESINSSFNVMGANTFTIKQMWNSQKSNRERRKNNLNISYYEAKQFKEEYIFPSLVSFTYQASWNGILKYESVKTNPNIAVIGIDDSYLGIGGYNLERGRGFSTQDIEMSRNVVILGSELVNTLFGATGNPLDKEVQIGNGRYKVVGVLESKGTSFGGPGDKICFIPITNVRQYFPRPNANHIIHIKPDDPNYMDFATGEAEALFRKIRKLQPQDESDFELERSDNLANMLIENIKYVTWSATIIGLITLLGAAIGLMNIMLVAVSERTREIGTRKALGAKNKEILQQFLFESVIIGQIGGVFGIIFGIIGGNIISFIFKTDFVIPWMWIIGGVLLCFFVGIASGYLPARKASKLEPIVALHYE
ncbi:MAG: ABC transporter permease [Bacteroidales bacterium]|nr:ABC transporter permease [Bacteroidales bacterium]